MSSLQLGAQQVNGKTLYSDLPPALKKEFDDFASFLKTNVLRCSDEIAQHSTHAFDEVKRDIAKLEEARVTLSNAVERDYHCVLELKRGVRATLKAAEAGKRRWDMLATPGAQGQLRQNVLLPSPFFWDLEMELEERLEIFRKQLNELEQVVHSTSQPKPTMTPQLLQETIANQHEFLVTLASQVSTLHDKLQDHKEEYLDFRRKYLNDPANPFEEADRREKNKQKKKSLAASMTPQQVQQLQVQAQQQAMLMQQQAAGQKTGAFGATGFGAKPGGFGAGATGFGAGATGFGAKPGGFGATGATGFGAKPGGFGATGATGFGAKPGGFGATGATGFGAKPGGFGATGATGFGAKPAGGFGAKPGGFGATGATTSFGAKPATGFGAKPGGFGATGATTSFGAKPATGFSTTGGTSAFGAKPAGAASGFSFGATSGAAPGAPPRPSGRRGALSVNTAPGGSFGSGATPALGSSSFSLGGAAKSSGFSFGGK